MKLLSLFDGGRRYGGAPSEYCEYIIFSPAEVAELLAEARQVVDLEAEWSHPDFPPEGDKELIDPVGRPA